MDQQANLDASETGIPAMDVGSSWVVAGVVNQARWFYLSFPSERTPVTFVSFDREGGGVAEL